MGDRCYRQFQCRCCTPSYPEIEEMLTGLESEHWERHLSKKGAEEEGEQERVERLVESPSV